MSMETFSTSSTIAMSDSTSTTLRSLEGTRNPDEVRVVSVNEYKQAAQCLAEAFADDEVAGYFINTPATERWSSKRKWNLHVSILQYVVAAHCLKGLVTTIGPNYDCVALWLVTIPIFGYGLRGSLTIRLRQDAARQRYG